MNFYVSIFKNSRVVDVRQEIGTGRVRDVEFELDGRKFAALNSGEESESYGCFFKFNEAISLIIDCKDQSEVDYFWDKFMSNGGTEQVCGWLKDKWGLSWQVVPNEVKAILRDADQTKSKRALEAMLKMKKIDIAAVKKAFDGQSASA